MVTADSLIRAVNMQSRPSISSQTRTVSFVFAASAYGQDISGVA
jgi:hypothetical protein